MYRPLSARVDNKYQSVGLGVAGRSAGNSDILLAGDIYGKQFFSIYNFLPERIGRFLFSNQINHAFVRYFIEYDGIL